jgi:hypothetical protein
MLKGVTFFFSSETLTRGRLVTHRLEHDAGQRRKVPLTSIDTPLSGTQKALPIFLHVLPRESSGPITLATPERF